MSGCGWSEYGCRCGGWDGRGGGTNQGTRQAGTSFNQQSTLANNVNVISRVAGPTVKRCPESE